MKRILLLPLFFLLSCTNQQGSTKVVNGISFQSLKLNNDLEVLLVSDKRFKKSAAAMAVGVGSFEDPKNQAGLAHYLEHMLFMGTKKYPKHDEYGQFVSENGGYSNAYTADSVTNYFFEVDHKALPEALDRFAQFFISPLFDENFLEKEKNAVNSEFDKNILNDTWRLFRLQSWTSKKDHPTHQFSIGSLKTLEKVKREDVVRFYEKYYSANQMRLVISSAKPLSELKSLALLSFKEVKNKSLKPLDYPDHFFPDNEGSSPIYFVKSIADMQSLKLVFNTEDVTDYWASKPLSILSGLFGDERKGSILSYLKEQGLATALSAYGQKNTFVISVNLTKKGLKDYKHIISAILSYRAFLKGQGYKKYYFKDRRDLMKLDYMNLDPVNSGSITASIAATLLDNPAEDYLERRYLLSSYSKDNFKKFLDQLSEKNLQIYIAHPKAKTDQKESPFGVEYRKEVWKEESPLRSFAFKYPEKNIYVPNEFQLAKPLERGEPQVIKKSYGELIYQKDTELERAKSFWAVGFYSEVEDTPKNYLLAYLYTLLKKEDFNHRAYPALEARYSYNLAVSTADILALQVFGYSHHAGTLLLDLIKSEKDSLKTIQVTPEYFEKIKEQVRKGFVNRDYIPAYQRLFSEFGPVFKTKTYSPDEYEKYLDGLQLEDVKKYAARFFQKLHYKLLVYGNVTKQEAENTFQMVASRLQAAVLTEKVANARRSRFYKVPPSKEVYEKISGKNNNNAFLTMYQIADWSMTNQALVSVVGELLSNPYFSHLRSEKQLGYFVRAFSESSQGYVALVTMIQSQKYSFQNLSKQSEEFLLSYLKKMSENLDQARLDGVRNAMIEELSRLPNSVEQRSQQFLSLTFGVERDYEFNAKLIKLLKEMTVVQVQSFIKKILSERTFSRFSFYYQGEGATKEASVPSGQKVKSLQQWARELESHNPYGPKEAI